MPGGVAGVQPTMAAPYADPAWDRTRPFTPGQLPDDMPDDSSKSGNLPGRLSDMVANRARRTAAKAHGFKA